MSKSYTQILSKVEPKPVNEPRLPSPESIKPKATDCDCLISIKKKDGYWTVDATEYPITARDMNEIKRQLTMWLRRYKRKLALNQYAKKGEQE